MYNHSHPNIHICYENYYPNTMKTAPYYHLSVSTKHDLLHPALRKYQEFSANSSFVASILIDRRYFIAKTAIVRVLPSRKG